MPISNHEKLTEHKFQNYICTVESAIKSKTVFYDHLAIYIGETDKEIQPANVIMVSNKVELTKYLDAYFQERQSKDILIVGPDSYNLFKDFKKYFKYIKAAGGLVKNDHGNYLFIRRNDMWDLPKGKKEKDESPEECAIREVEEETGISNPIVKEKLPSTYHIYSLKGAFVLKKTYWYLMEVEGHQQLKPQQEENIAEVIWFDSEESSTSLSQSYRSLRVILSPFVKD